MVAGNNQWSQWFRWPESLSKVSDTGLGAQAFIIYPHLLQSLSELLSLVFSSEKAILNTFTKRVTETSYFSISSISFNDFTIFTSGFLNINTSFAFFGNSRTDIIGIAQPATGLYVSAMFPSSDLWSFGAEALEILSINLNAVYHEESFTLQLIKEV